MKLSIDHAFICRKFGLKEGLTLIKKAGFDGIDYSFCEFTPKAVIFPDDFRQNMKDLAETLKEIGLYCEQTYAPFQTFDGPQVFHFGEEMTMSNPHFADMVYSLEATALLGAKQCVYRGLAVPKGGYSEQYMDFNYSFFKALEPFAKEYGVKIGIANSDKKSGNLYKAQWQDDLLKKLDSPVFYAFVDIGNAAASDTTPDVYLRNVNYEQVQGICFHDFNTQEVNVIPGLGETDWTQVAVALAEIGYKGNLHMKVSTYELLPDQVIPTALDFAAESGRVFIRMFEKANNALK